MKRLTSLILAVIALVFFSGCATVLSPDTHSLSVDSEPKKAKVYVNGSHVGTTPIKLNLTANQSYQVTFKKEGYEDLTQEIKPKVDGGWVVLDVGTGVFPLFVDASTNEWNMLEKDKMNAKFKEKQVITRDRKGSRIPSAVGIGLMALIFMII